jgi:benzoyl-CoA reductase/2-hydroxyglutaryl-CoA dehydratase subunit BcrC/BadD/HgdB
VQTETSGRERGVQYHNLLNLVGEIGNGAQSPGPSLKASRMRSIVNCHRLAEAYKEQSKVAYVSEQFPAEIVFAFGAIPWNIESMAIMLAQSADVNRILQLTQEKEMSRDICSFLRGPFGMMLADCYPTPDIVLTNDQPCEGLSKVMYMSGKRYQAPVLGLHSPNTIDDDSVTYLAKQMEQMMARMEEEFGMGLDPDALGCAVKYSNQARSYYCKTLQLLEAHRLPGVSRELQEIFGMNYFGAKENAQICRALYEESLEMAKQETTNIEAGSKGKRVLWIGQVPEESHELLRHMSEAVDIVFWAPLWEANTRMLDEGQPLRSIAERTMRYHWNAERMGAEIARMCEAYEIDGFLIANVWGCRNMMGLTPMFRDFGRSKKLKYLTINIDLVDRNNYAFSHVKNRVDAFLELMQ